MERMEWNGGDGIVTCNCFFCIKSGGLNQFHQKIFQVLDFVQSMWKECCTETEVRVKIIV